MALFHTGFNVDAHVPVASTSTATHETSESAHRKRKRSNSKTNNHTSPSTLANESLSNESISNTKSKSQAKVIQNAKAKTANNGTSNATAGSKSSDANTKEHRTAEAVVNIEKLMKKLEKMEKNGGGGGKALKDDGSSPMKNKKARIEKADKSAKDNGKGKNNADSATSGSASASAAQATSESIAPKNEKKSTKNKKNKDKKKKKETDSVKPEYIPDAEALAKREERKRKKEARLAGSTKASSTSAATGAEDGDMAVDGDAEADVSSMHIDTLEEAAAPALEPILSADARTPMSSKKMKQKTKTDIAMASPAAVEVNSVKAKDVIEDGMTDLQKRMQKKLGGARFRWINEQLYTTSGVDALQLMEEDPAMFEDYHNGFASQAQSWPSQPIHIFIDDFKRLYLASTTNTSKPVIADLGCGKAELAQTLVPLGFNVLSYDLVEEEPYIVKAQCTKRLPLPGKSLNTKKGKETEGDNGEGAVVNYVVCCLSLMGSDWLGMIKEARRVLKMGGKLKIAEVTSRFTDVKDFIKLINAVGFKLLSKDDSNTHFILFEFEKIPVQACKSPFLSLSEEDKTAKSQELLKPCIYKRR